MFNIKNILAKGAASIMSDRDIILTEYQEFSNSPQRSWMLTGQRYYEGDNNLGSVDDEQTLKHPFMKELVDEKVSYLLSKPYALTSDNEGFIEAVKASLGSHFGYLMTRIGYESSNKGIAWVQPYIDSTGKFRLMLIPSEQCCPIWTSNSHDELSGMIRTYSIATYEGRSRKDKTCIEYWTSTGLEFYEVRDGKLFEDVEAYSRYGVDTNGNIGHYIKDGTPMSWGRVPFVAFKNNSMELPDIKFVKSLIDSYDDSRSEVAAFLGDVRNLIYVLKGYGGADLKEFMSDLRKYRAVKIDDPQDGGVDTINPQMDISAAAQHYERLATDIERFAQGLPKDIDRLGSNPSGIALKFHYSPLDLKCSAMENEFKFGFENLIYFVKVYLSEAGKGSYVDCDIDMIFNKDVAVNEQATIESLIMSKDLLSQKTLLGQHPWVHDVEEEVKQLEIEGAAKQPDTNNI